jgi:hypothetical protein
MRNCWSFFSTFIYEKVGRGYANQSKASRAEKPWSLATGVARNRKPQPYTRNPKPWSLTRRVARNRKPHTHMRKLKPWSLATGVARFTKPHPYKHVHAQIKAVGSNKSRTLHQAAPVQPRTRATQSRGPLQ